MTISNLKRLWSDATLIDGLREFDPIFFSIILYCNKNLILKEKKLKRINLIL